MSELRTVRLGIIGCGGIAQVHGEAGQRVPEVQFIACSDIRQDRAEQWAAQFGCPAWYLVY